MYIVGGTESWVGSASKVDDVSVRADDWSDWNIEGDIEASIRACLREFMPRLHCELKEQDGDGREKASTLFDVMDGEGEGAKTISTLIWEPREWAGDGELFTRWVADA